MVKLNRKSLNIESTNLCTLQCPTCKRTDFKEKYGSKTPLPGGTITTKELAKCIKYFDGFMEFCGQHSDPIFSPHLAEMLAFLKENNHKASVITAASHRPEEWYIKAFEANKNAKWTFGIDGPPRLSNTYRINQDGEHLFMMMVLARQMGLKVTWKHIVFNYNEIYIDECKSLAKAFDLRFDIVIPSRSLPKKLKPVTKKWQWKTYRQKENEKELKPLCIHKQGIHDQQVCLNSEGYFTPCCWFDSEDGRKADKRIDGFFDPSLNIKNNDNVEDIIEGEYWQNFFKSLTEDPDNAPKKCKRHCKTSKPMSLKVHDKKKVVIRVAI